MVDVVDVITWWLHNHIPHSTKKCNGCHMPHTSVMKNEILVFKVKAGATNFIDSNYLLLIQITHITNSVILCLHSYHNMYESCPNGT